MTRARNFYSIWNIFHEASRRNVDVLNILAIQRDGLFMRYSISKVLRRTSSKKHGYPKKRK